MTDTAQIEIPSEDSVLTEFELIMDDEVPFRCVIVFIGLSKPSRLSDENEQCGGCLLHVVGWIR